MEKLEANARPIIGITMRPGDRGAGGRLDGVQVQLQNQAYLSALVDAGGVPLVLPLLDDPQWLRPLYEQLDGLCLPGGPDVDPHRYGQERRPDCNLDESVGILDSCELQLLEWALEDDLPVLAICRGQQVLNVACQGTLWQDLAVEAPALKVHRQAGARNQTTHPIEVARGSQFGVIVGSDSLDVNSLHHQAIRDLGNGLVVTATSPDGVIEAVEFPGKRFVLGVQFHPEELTASNSAMSRLFGAFIAATR